MVYLASTSRTPPQRGASAVAMWLIYRLCAQAEELGKLEEDLMHMTDRVLAYQRGKAKEQATSPGAEAAGDDLKQVSAHV